MSSEQQPITDEDLAYCAQEPIHIPGAIQSYGYLFVCSKPKLKLLQVSANVEALLGRSPEALLGQTLAVQLDDELARQVWEAAQDARLGEVELKRLHIAGRTFDLAAHESEDAIVLELLPFDEGAQQVEAGLLRAVRALQSITDIEALRRTVVQVVRELTGFDRVMLYRFDEAGHGEVIAEDKLERLPPYLGLRYPATDIPAQARELYRSNWLRLIPDAAYEPVPLVPERRPDTGKALDMSHAVLRSVSPIHREYMANAGFAASMSISLLDRGELWGLISCVHCTPRRLSQPVLRACESIGRLMSLQHGALQEFQKRTQREAKQSLLQRLAVAMRASRRDVPMGLLREPQALLELVGAAGAAIAVDEEIQSIGRCPPVVEIDALAKHVLQLQQRGVFHTDHLQELHPPAAHYTDVAAGVLAIAAPPPVRRVVLWFLPEQMQTVNWAGKPVKRVEQGPEGPRLHPRRSFELWQDFVSGRSRAWTPTELWAAAELRRSLIELDLERRVVREREAVRAREELLGVVSHDLRTPLSVIRVHTGLIRRELDKQQALEPERLAQVLGRMERAGERMQALIEDLLVAHRIDAGGFELEKSLVAAQALVDEAFHAMAPVAEKKGVRLERSAGEAAMVLADAGRLAQVFSNLLSNALRFTPEGGVVRLGVNTTPGRVEFTVEDTGPGIPTEQQEKIFQRYHAAGAKGGTGLGLYIARGLVEAHGGRLGVRSRPGEGSCFYFDIPRA